MRAVIEPREHQQTPGNYPLQRRTGISWHKPLGPGRRRLNRKTALQHAELDFRSTLVALKLKAQGVPRTIVRSTHTPLCR